MGLYLDEDEVTITPPDGKKVIALNASGAPVIVDSTGESTDIGGGGAAATADAPADAATFTAALNVSTVSLKGLQSVHSRMLEPRFAASPLTDASVTLTPGTDKVSAYIVLPATYTQTRTITLAGDDCATNDICEIIFLQTTGNFNIVIQNASASAQATANCATNGQARTYMFYFNGSVWATFAYNRWLQG